MARWSTLDVAEGLEEIARDEVRERWSNVRWLASPGAGSSPGPLRVAVPPDDRGRTTFERALTTVRTVHAVWTGMRFDVPRPKALLGDQTMAAVVADVRRVVDARPGGFSAVRLHAAGSDSSVMQRLASAVAASVDLPVDDLQGDLHVRVVPARGAEERGWEVEVRTTPRPSSARAWRKVDLAGGLDACIAAAVWRIAGVRPRARILNLMCGGGTLLAERHLVGPVGTLVGVDLDPVARRAARTNLEAAGATDVTLLDADATATGLADGSFDQIVVDPPWGDAVGQRDRIHAEIPRWLDEAHRLLVPGGDLVVVTHAIRAFDAALAARGDRFVVRRRLRVWQGGHRPALVHLVTRERER